MAELGEKARTVEERFMGSIEAATEHGLLEEGDQVVITGGTRGSIPGSTNMLEIHIVGEDR